VQHLIDISLKIFLAQEKEKEGAKGLFRQEYTCDKAKLLQEVGLRPKGKFRHDLRCYSSLFWVGI